MGLGQRNQPVQALPANRANYALANGIRLWAAGRGLQYLDSERADRLVEMFCKNTIAIMNQKFVSHSIPDRLTQLLQGPVGTRMSCNVAMDQASAAVLESSRRRSFLTCAPLRTGQASWPRIRLKHGESPSFQGAGTRSSLAENLPLAIRNRR